MRKPQMINDPNAAPAAMRADDVDLQAQEGDFIMGYPAMQQNGPRVRSLVERAMLRAKDAGVKTKGYKHGDKVDILVHNGEMQIPNQLVNYIDGGYATLKKLNKPSKYDEGDVVMPGGLGGKTISDTDMEAMSGGLDGKNISDTDMSVMSEIQNKETKRNKYPVGHPTIGSMLFAGDNPVKGKMAWERANKIMKNIFHKDEEFNDKPKEANNRLYIEAMDNLKKAIESGVDSKSLHPYDDGAGGIDYEAMARDRAKAKEALTEAAQSHIDSLHPKKKMKMTKNIKPKKMKITKNIKPIKK